MKIRWLIPLAGGMTGTRRPQLLVALLWLAVLCVEVAPLSPDRCDTLVTEESSFFILTDHGGSYQLKLAEKELRRYLYLRTGKLAESVSHVPVIGPQDVVFVVACHNSPTLRALLPLEELKDVTALEPQRHIVSSSPLGKATRSFLCVGFAPVDTLYAVYSFIESLGVRFYLHGDVVPSDKLTVLPCVKKQFAPGFEVRGIQPFHDFPEGPDWWSVDDYKAHISQIAKMKMNFIGLHTYPLNALAEPTVWQGGPASSLAQNYTVLSSYSAAYFSTLQDVWGYTPVNSSDFSWGNAKLYAHDCATGNSPLMDGLCPRPTTMIGENNLFDRTAQFLGEVYSHARKIGVQTCVGTETPITKVNSSVSSMDYYRATFEWVAHNFDIDYYWLWTSEAWEWGDVTTSDHLFTEAKRDLIDAYLAWGDTKSTFQLATGGWVLGPADDRTYWDTFLPAPFTISSLDRDLGNDPIDPAYADVIHHKKWIIPWLEDDPGLLGIQLWVNRTMEHALAAYSYNCSGVLGIHWRTWEVAPQLSAMSQLMWNLSLSSSAFWEDFATNQFGSTIASRAAAIFAQHESFNTPRPVIWVNGPGGLTPNQEGWATVSQQYQFVEDFARLRTLVQGVDNLQRFDYWDQSLQSLRAIAKAECTWGAVDTFFESQIFVHTDPSSRQKVAKTGGLAVLKNLTNDLTDMMLHLQQTIYSTGELGSVVNVETHSWPGIRRAAYAPVNALLAYIGCYQDGIYRDLSGPEEITGVQYGDTCFCGDSYGKYGELPYTSCHLPCNGDGNYTCGGWNINSVYSTKGVLPENILPSVTYAGSPRLIIPTVRTSLDPGEALRLRAILLASAPATSVALHLRLLGKPTFQTVPFVLESEGRAVYTLTVPAHVIAADFEYYVTAVTNGTTLYFPVGAPAITQTVVVV